MILGRILLDPEPAPANGQTPPVDQEKVTLKGILAKHGNDANAALIELSPIMANMSKRLGALTAENAELKAKVPAEGSILVPADKAKLWDVVKDLADDPKEVARRLKDFPEVEKELTGIKSKARKDALALVARVDGRKVDPEVFAEFFGDHEMVEKVTKDKGTGKEVKTLFVKHKDGEKDVETEFGEFAKKVRPKLIPVLAPRASASADPDDDIDEDEAPEVSRSSRLSAYDEDEVARPGRGSDVERVIASSRGRYGR